MKALVSRWRVRVIGSEVESFRAPSPEGLKVTNNAVAQQ
jgi:hypothetical protein